MAQTGGGSIQQGVVPAAGQTGMEPASLVVSRASVTPAGAGVGFPAVNDSVLAAAPAVVPTAAVAPAAIDRLLATQPVPESNAVASAIVTRASSGRLPAPGLMPSGRPFALLPASPVPHSDAAVVDHAGGQPAVDVTPRLAAPRTAASGEASDQVLLHFVDARPGNAAARAGNQHPATRLFGLDLPTLDLLAAAATKWQ